MSGYDIDNENYEDIHANHVDFMEACGAFEGPDVLDPRPWYKIEMQWAMSSCVGNAETGPFEVSYRNKTGKIAQFSRMFAYLEAQRYSDIVQPGQHYFGRDGGALIAGARKQSIELGGCFESTMPYPRSYTTNIPPEAVTEAANFKMGSSSVIGKESDDPFMEAKAYLSSGMGGLLVGAPWPFNLGQGFTLTNFRNFGYQGHAWCILGYLKDLLVAANSHDVTFADKGFFYINRQGFNEMVANRKTTVVGLSDLSVPRGRVVDWTKESMFS